MLIHLPTCWTSCASSSSPSSWCSTKVRQSVRTTSLSVSEHFPDLFSCTNSTRRKMYSRGDTPNQSQLRSTWEELLLRKLRRQPTELSSRSSSGSTQRFWRMARWSWELGSWREAREGRQEGGSPSTAQQMARKQRKCAGSIFSCCLYSSRFRMLKPSSRKSCWGLAKMAATASKRSCRTSLSSLVASACRIWRTADTTALATLVCCSSSSSSPSCSSSSSTSTPQAEQLCCPSRWAQVRKRRRRRRRRWLAKGATSSSRRLSRSSKLRRTERSASRRAVQSCRMLGRCGRTNSTMLGYFSSELKALQAQIRRNTSESPPSVSRHAQTPSASSSRHSPGSSNSQQLASNWHARARTSVGCSPRSSGPAKVTMSWISCSSIALGRKSTSVDISAKRYSATSLMAGSGRCRQSQSSPSSELTASPWASGRASLRRREKRNSFSCALFSWTQSLKSGKPEKEREKSRRKRVRQSCRKGMRWAASSRAAWESWRLAQARQESARRPSSSWRWAARGRGSGSGSTCSRSVSTRARVYLAWKAGGKAGSGEKSGLACFWKRRKRMRRAVFLRRNSEGRAGSASGARRSSTFFTNISRLCRFSFTTLARWKLIALPTSLKIETRMSPVSALKFWKSLEASVRRGRTVRLQRLLSSISPRTALPKTEKTARRASTAPRRELSSQLEWSSSTALSTICGQRRGQYFLASCTMIQRQVGVNLPSVTLRMRAGRSCDRRVARSCSSMWQRSSQWSCTKFLRAINAAWRSPEELATSSESSSSWMGKPWVLRSCSRWAVAAWVEAGSKVPNSTFATLALCIRIQVPIKLDRLINPSKVGSGEKGEVCRLG